MKRTTNVVQLKSRLSEYLRLVKAGNEIVVTERGVPVARIVPLDAAERSSTRRVRLARSGVLRPGRGRLPRTLTQAPKGPHAGVLGALLADRHDPDTER